MKGQLMHIRGPPSLRIKNARDQAPQLDGHFLSQT